MKLEPKYLIKFTNVQNDNGTVWYTIDVRPSSFRFFIPRRTSTGLSRKDLVTCGICTLLVKRASIRISYLSSRLASFLTALMRPSSKNAKRSSRTTIILFSKVLILRNFLSCFTFSILTSRSRNLISLTTNRQKSKRRALSNPKRRTSSSNWRKSLSR